MQPNNPVDKSLEMPTRHEQARGYAVTNPLLYRRQYAHHGQPLRPAPFPCYLRQCPLPTIVDRHKEKTVSEFMSINEPLKPVNSVVASHRTSMDTSARTEDNDKARFCNIVFDRTPLDIFTLSRSPVDLKLFRHLVKPDRWRR